MSRSGFFFTQVDLRGCCLVDETGAEAEAGLLGGDGSCCCCSVLSDRNVGEYRRRRNRRLRQDSATRKSDEVFSM